METKENELIAILDVETAGPVESALMYDLSVIIVDYYGNVYDQGQWVIDEVFSDKPLMDTAIYYKQNAHFYEGKETSSLKNTFYDLLVLLLRHKISTIYAYNATFDYKAILNTDHHFKSSNVLPEILMLVDFKCIQNMCCRTIYLRKEYKEFCNKHNLFTPKGYLPTGVQAGFQFITNNPNFQEDHTAQSDILIEYKLFLEAHRQNPNVTSVLDRNCWAIPNKELIEAECNADQTKFWMIQKYQKLWKEVGV